jgi:hypothetical protein
MAGLLAARILSDHFEQVTVIERDQLKATPPHKLLPKQVQEIPKERNERRIHKRLVYND